jgi:hypothetical protein
MRKNVEGRQCGEEDQRDKNANADRRKKTLWKKTDGECRTSKEEE